MIRDELREILELVPCVPRLQRLNVLLKGREYDEGQDEGEDENEMRQADEGEGNERPVCYILFVLWCITSLKGYS